MVVRMPEVWTPDDLTFAVVRAARLESPGQVAEDLLAAAAQPSRRLDGVTALEARLRAADVLIEAGRTGDAIAIARQVIGDAGNVDESLAAAAVLARAGAPGEAEDAAIRAVRAQPGGYPAVGGLMALSLRLAGYGYFDQALRIADETLAVARGRSLPAARLSRSAGLAERVIRLAELAREQILEFQQDAAEAGAGLTGLRPAPAGPGGYGEPPWPALAGHCLLWWPRAEYLRVVRQVPELRAIATVQATLTAASMTEPGQLTLTPAEFGRFAQYLENTRADPRLAGVMTAFTQQADPAYRHPAPWPPRRRSPCWCGSGDELPALLLGQIDDLLPCACGSRYVLTSPS